MKGTKGAFIESDEQIENVLLSVFMNWHIVLSFYNQLKNFN